MNKVQSYSHHFVIIDGIRHWVSEPPGWTHLLVDGEFKKWATIKNTNSTKISSLDDPK